MAHVAFQMDPIEAVDPKADSTFRLAEEAQRRGHTIYVYGPHDLTYDTGQVRAFARKAIIQRDQNPFVALGPTEDLELAAMDVVWLRQDPPFDMGYITTTHILDHLAFSGTIVVNDPFWVRNFPEKLLVLNFPELTPPTMVARSLERLRDFKTRHGDIIVKPLYGNGGAGVFRLGPDDKNLNSLHELFIGINREPLIAQAFLPAVAKGDKRVILVNGEPVGAINRVPAPGETRSNMHVGGRAEKVGLSERDLEICAAIGPTLRDNGQVFVGIDVIGDYLTEINVTSPTGIQELERFDGTNVAALIWEAIEAKLD
ncbi:MAG: glutathione synthase [Pseudomonadota bacterium]